MTNERKCVCRLAGSVSENHICGGFVAPFVGGCCIGINPMGDTCGHYEACHTHPAEQGAKSCCTRAAEDMRERCAKVCDELAATNKEAISDEWWHAQGECAAAIRKLPPITPTVSVGIPAALSAAMPIRRLLEQSK